MNGPEVGFLGLRDVFDEPSCSELAFLIFLCLGHMEFSRWFFYPICSDSRFADASTGSLTCWGMGEGRELLHQNFCWIFFFGRRWAKQTGFAAHRTYMCVCVCAAATAAGCWLGTWRHNYWFHETFIENIYELIESSLFFLITDSYVSSWLLLGAE